MFELDEVSAILSRAVAAVESANVPSDYRIAAYERAVDLLARRVQFGGEMPADRALVPLAQARDPRVGDLSPMDTLASRVRLAREMIERVYTEGDEGLSITVFPDQLAKSRSAGARELALLVAAADQATSDRPTSADEIRRAAEEYDKFDGPNFAATLATMKGTFQISGPSRARTYKLTKPGWIAAGTLIARLAGAEKTAA